LSASDPHSLPDPFGPLLYVDVEHIGETDVLNRMAQSGFPVEPVDKALKLAERLLKLLR
jgi:hypothetical protein